MMHYLDRILFCPNGPQPAWAWVHLCEYAKMQIWPWPIAVPSGQHTGSL
jgi:hypothetical protein